MQISFSPIPHKRNLEIDDSSHAKKQKIDEEVNEIFRVFTKSLRSSETEKNKKIRLNQFWVFQDQWLKLNFTRDQIIPFVVDRLKSGCSQDMLERIQVHLNSFIKYSKLIEQFAPIVEDLKKTNSSEFQFHLHIQKMRQIKASLLKQHEEGIVDCIVKRALVSLRSPAAADAFIKKYLKGVNDKDSEEVEKQAELRKVMKPFIDKFLKHQRQGKDYQSDINNIKKKKLELIQKYDAHYIDKVVTDLFRERKYWSSSIFIEKHLKSINGDMLVFDHLISIVQSF